MSEARCVLIVDDQANSLGDIALRLIRIGIDVYYAKDRAEAWLLAQQEAAHIRILLFPPTIDLDDAFAVAACLRSEAPKARLDLLVIGERPDEAERRRLREGGVEWALWEPDNESCLRSIVSAAMSPVDRVERAAQRKHRRLPTTLLARAFVGTCRKDAVVSTLSLGGAFLETPRPFTEGTRIRLEIALPAAPLLLRAEVVYERDTGDGSQPIGMGVEFSDLAPEAEEQLGVFLFDQEDLFGV
jgi:hypothetical protein